MAPVLIGLLAFGLGLVRLTSQPRSYDERITIETATKSLDGIWRAARSTEAPHFLYYLLMKPWLALFGTSDFSARFPSVVAGALSALMLTMVGTRLFGRWPGVISGVMLVLAAFVMHFWQWARGYSLALLLTLVATYALLRVFEAGCGRWAALWSVSLVFACWLNLFSISILAAYAIAYALLERKPPGRLVASSTGGLVLGVAPLIVLVVTADNGQLNWIPTPTIRRVAVQSWDWSSRNPFALLAAAIAIVALVKQASQATDRWKAGLVITWTLAPFLLTLALSVIQPAFDAHYLLTAAAGLALLIGVGVSSLPRPASLILLALVVAGGSLQLAHYYVAPGKPLSSLF